MNTIKKVAIKLLNLNDPDSHKIIYTTVTIKLVILGLIIISYNLFKFNTFNYYDNFLANPNKQISIIDAFSTWDAQHYIFLSKEGYQKSSISKDGVEINNHVSNAFYPLYPYLIKTVNYLIHNPVISGLIISNLASLLGSIYFYKFVKENFDTKKARWSAIFLLAFPTSFFFTLMYTESLFFLFTILFFIFLLRNNYKLASIFALLLPLTRPNGILIIIPFIFYYLFENYKKHRFTITKYFKWEIIFLCSPIIGMILYFATMQMLLGDFRMGYRAQSFYLADNSIKNILNPIHWVAVNFINVKWTWHDYQNSFLDRFFFISYLIALVPIWKLKQKNFFVFALVFGMIPALSGTLSSFMRYLLVVFPIFIALAITLKSNWQKYALFGAFCLLQVALLILHSLNYWVA